MSTIQEESRLVGKLSRMQMKKLHANRHKGHWSDMTPGQLMSRAVMKFNLTQRAIESGDEKVALEKAADTSNFMAMAVENMKLKHVQKNLR